MTVNKKSPGFFPPLLAKQTASTGGDPASSAQLHVSEAADGAMSSLMLNNNLVSRHFPGPA